MRNYTLTLITFLLLLSSCRKENTVWETDWSAPIINDTLSLNHLVNDSTLTATSGFYFVDLNRTLLNRGVNDVLSIPDTTIQNNEPFTFNFIFSPGAQFDAGASENDLGFRDVELKQIIPSNGVIEFTVKNPVETKVSITIKLIGVSKNGVPFSGNIIVAPGTIANPSSATGIFDLSGYSFDLTGVDGNKRNILTSKVIVQADPNGQPVQVTTSHVLQVEVKLKGIELAYARGYFGNQIVSDTTDFNLELMKLVQSGMVDIPGSTIKFEIENGIKVGATGLLTKLVSESNSGNSVALSHPQIGTAFTLNPATGGWSGINPSLKEIVFDENNSNLEAFLENLGSKYTAGYKVEINPWGNISAGSDEIYPDSRFKVRAHVNMPLTIGMDGLVVRDTFAVDLSQTSTSAHVTKGELLLKASNAFPISANVKLILLNTNKSVIHTVNSSDLIQSAEYGTIDATSGLKVMNSDVKWVLSDNVLKDLNKVKYIIVQSDFNTPNPNTNSNQQFQIPAGAFLGVKLRTRFTTENTL